MIVVWPGAWAASRRAGLVRLATGTAPRYAAMVAPLLVAGGHLHGAANRATAAMSAVRPDQLGKTAGANSTLQRLDGACLSSPGGH